MRARPRIYQLICVLLAIAILVVAAEPAHLNVTRAKSRLLGPAQREVRSEDLDSFALSLMLGGFRGPLVMYLWVAGEEEKNRYDTEKALTRAELIADLQPQFVTVYVHRSWDLAYNISVQYNRPIEKYRWIQEGIKFAEKGERRLPQNPDILIQLAQFYYQKLGNSYESDYYRAHFREESLDHMLDEGGYLLPEYAGRRRYIDHLDAVIPPWREREDPESRVIVGQLPPEPQTARHRWPYGVSVFAIAYDYYKQAAVPGLPRHNQFGPSVVDSQPSIAMRAWVDEELGLATDTEQSTWSWDSPLPTDPDAALKVDGRRQALEKALFHYDEACDLAMLAQAEYYSHLQRYPDKIEVYTSHLNDMLVKFKLARAGSRRLNALLTLARPDVAATARADARRLLAEAVVGYEEAVRMIGDYIDTEYRLPPGMIEDRMDSQRARYYALSLTARRAIAQIKAILNPEDTM